MIESNVGNNKYLKRLNETEILNLIRTYRAISKAELSQITGLSPTAVGIIVSGLIEKDYIHETGVGDSNGGRRPVLYELKPHSFYSIGIDIDVDNMNAVLMDIAGNIIHEDLISMPEDISFESVINKVGDAVKGIMARYSKNKDDFLGLGISVPGLVKSEIHKIIFAPNLNWRNISMESYLNNLPDIPVYVENEAKASAICEKWIGCCKDIENFVCINMKSGIGAGIFIDGRLYKGVGGAAGEVGHIVVEEEGPRCGCGNYGCLETVAATGWIIEEVKKMVRKGTAPGLKDIEDLDSLSI
ncbi:MAG: ROK family transcriptional regulator, partial [Bacillota bacterium]